MSRRRAFSADEIQRLQVVLGEIIEEAGSQAEAARRLGISQQSVSAGSNGWGLGLHTVRAVAMYRGTTIDALAGGVGVDPNSVASLRRKVWELETELTRLRQAVAEAAAKMLETIG